MNTATNSLSPELDAFFQAAAPAALVAARSAYIEQGARLVTPEAWQTLQAALPKLHRKAAEIRDSARLRHRLEILLRYASDHADAGRNLTDSAREIGFVLLYFYQGHDMIPDSVPEIGLLDDALLVETVMRRQEEPLRTHWRLKSLTWEDNW